MKNLTFLTEKLIAHRGFFDHKNGIPENSMQAFQRAMEDDYIIELDVHLLKDGKVIVFHDDNLKRMTGLDKPVKDCDYVEIKKLNLLETREKIPLLEDVLNFVNGKVALLIELKYDVKVGLLEKEVLEILQKYDGKYAVQSFSPKSIFWFKKNAPEVARGQLASGFEKSKMNKIEKFFMSNMIFNYFTKPDFIAYDVKSIDKILHKKKQNDKILAWTVRDKPTFEKYVEKCDNLICENLNFLTEMAWKNKKNDV